MCRSHAVLAVLLFFTFYPGPVQAYCPAEVSGETARGSVFLDANANHRRDGAEQGIAGVAVSNGCQVVLTDDQGNYEILLEPLQILFVSKPADYQVPVDDNNVPRFYYRHYPEGTPDVVAGTSVAWLFPVTEPTGPLPDSIDFPLLALEDADPVFRAHGFADTQARQDLGQDMLREELINPLIGNPHGVDFGLTVGDVVYDNLALYPRHRAMMGLMGIPQWYLPGNHDLNYESPDAVFANETYKRYFGPTYYSFNHGNVHFVMLNNVEYAGADPGSGSGGYRGFLPEAQLQWLARDLAHVPRDRLVVVASHIPLVTTAYDGKSDPASGPGTENLHELLRILEPFQQIYGLAGHDTSNSWKVQINHRHGWSGSPWIAHTLAEVRGNGWNTGPVDARGVRDAMMQDGNPNGYYVLHFDDDSLVPEFMPFPSGPDAGNRLRIVLDPPLVAPTGGGINRGYLRPATRAVVNLFDGGERDRVWVSLDGGPRQQMDYTVRVDPYMERVFARYQHTVDAFGAPTRSAHLWELTLPDNLGTGLHHLRVFSEDEFGQRRRASLTFEVLAAGN